MKLTAILASSITIGACATQHQTNDFVGVGSKAKVQ